MQRVHQGQRVNVEGWAKLGLRTVICWGRDRCLPFNELRHPKLISFTREQASFGISLPYSVKLGNALHQEQKLRSYEPPIARVMVASTRLVSGLAYAALSDPFSLCLTTYRRGQDWPRILTYLFRS